jgi:hypothetical protein
MSISYSISLRNYGGFGLGQYPIISLEIGLALNSISAATIEFASDFPSYIWEDGVLLDVWRTTSGHRHLVGDVSFIVTKPKYIWPDNVWRVECKSALQFLDNRIVAYTPETNYADKNSDNGNDGPADDLMKAFVRENMGSLALDTTRDLATYISIEGGKGEGVTAGKNAAWRNVLSTVRELAQISENGGTPIFFDLFNRGGTLVFQTMINQRGTDLSEMGVLFSTETGNIVEAEMSFDYEKERNMAYVGGEGNGAGRVVVEVVGDRAANPLLRKEVFHDMRDFATAVLSDGGKARLSELAARVHVDAVVTDSQSFLYGVDYRFGDRVLTQIGNRVITCTVGPVSLEYANGQEAANIQVTGSEPI